MTKPTCDITISAYTPAENYEYTPPNMKDALVPVIEHLHREIFESSTWLRFIWHVEKRIDVMINNLPSGLNNGYIAVDIYPRDKLEKPFCRMEDVRYRIPITLECNGVQKSFSIYGFFEKIPRRADRS